MNQREATTRSRHRADEANTDGYYPPRMREGSRPFNNLALHPIVSYLALHHFLLFGGELAPTAEVFEYGEAVDRFHTPQRDEIITHSECYLRMKYRKSHVGRLWTFCLDRFVVQAPLKARGKKKYRETEIILLLS